MKTYIIKYQYETGRSCIRVVSGDDVHKYREQELNKEFLIVYIKNAVIKAHARAPEFWGW